MKPTPYNKGTTKGSLSPKREKMLDKKGKPKTKIVHYFRRDKNILTEIKLKTGNCS